MRTLPGLLALLFVACGGSTPPPDVPGDTSLATDATAPRDTTTPPDVRDVPVADDGPTPPDVRDATIAEDTSVDATDATPQKDVPGDVHRDVPADRPDPCGAPGTLMECDVNGVPMCVNITAGRRQPDGTTLHCGRCNNTCAVGYACLGECTRL